MSGKYPWSERESKKAAEKKKFKPIPKVSDKRKKENAIYAGLRNEYLKANPNCKANLSGCQKTATDIHHTYFGKDRKANFLNVKTWLGVCRCCHSQIHNMPTIELLRLSLRNI